MVELAGRTVVAVLTRAPGAGGKSRLFRSLGIPADPRLLEALLLDTVEGAALAGVPRVVFVTPDEGVGEVRALVPGDVAVVGQGSGDLGPRMERAFDWLFSRGAAMVLLVGSDLPLLSAAVLAGAAEELAAHGGVVLGPSRDGGYYLIGSATTPRALLQDMPWGTPRMFALTIGAARQAGLTVTPVAPTTDVDTAGDLWAVAAAVSGGGRTKRWVASRFPSGRP